MLLPSVPPLMLPTVPAHRSAALSLVARLSLIAAGALALAALAPAHAAPLKPYASESEFQTAVDRWSERVLALRPQRLRSQANAPTGMLNATADSVSPAAMPSAKMAAPAAMQESAATAPSSDAITNVQVAGVDEGGIVKRAGDHLVILRRGRLFTVRVGGDALAPVAAVNAYAPDADPRGAWYDEMLISGSTVLVIGYSYARGGTEIGLFELGQDGSLSYRATWHLRSGDYYSSRNYASRLLGNRLVMYAPVSLQAGRRASPDALPGVRRWPGQGGAADFQRILPATRIYRSDDEFHPYEPLMLHTVISCDIAAAELRCDSTAILGPLSRTFHVSNAAVYVWTAASGRRGATPLEGGSHRSLAAVFRLPLDGSTPGMLKARGMPIDTQSFLEDARGHLNVLLREDGEGEGMWGAERGGPPRMALLRVPLTTFTGRQETVKLDHYRRLPDAPAGSVFNRFVGDWLLWGGTGATQAQALPFTTDRGPVSLELRHGTERIEALGGHALLVGRSGSDLGLSAVRLSAGDASLVDHTTVTQVSQTESRTHGFFYQPMGYEDGLLGLPVIDNGGDARPWTRHRAKPGASVMFVRVKDLTFQHSGRLYASTTGPVDDQCRASCVDWYGQSRPIFLGDRVLALLGYELVEGRVLSRGNSLRLEERRRVNFLMRTAARERAWPSE